MNRRRQPSASALATLGLRAAGVAHDIAQPLTAALLAARQVDGKGAAPLREALHRMEDLLQSIRAELHPDTAPPDQGPATRLAGMRRTLFASLCPADRRRIHLSLTGTVRTGGPIVERILGNLILNALRHGKGPVRAIGTVRGRKLRLSVEGGAGKTVSEPGWGIGLASCQDLAKRHGLRLRIEISPAGSRATLESRG